MMEANDLDRIRKNYHANWRAIAQNGVRWMEEIRKTIEEETDIKLWEITGSDNISRPVPAFLLTKKPPRPYRLPDEIDLEHVRCCKVASKIDHDVIDTLTIPLQKQLTNNRMFTLIPGSIKEKSSADCQRLTMTLGMSDYFSMLSQCDQFIYELAIASEVPENVAQDPEEDEWVAREWQRLSKKNFCDRHRPYHERWLDALRRISQGDPSFGYAGIGMSCTMLFKRYDEAKNCFFYTSLVHEKAQTTNILEKYHIMPAGMYQPGERSGNFGDKRMEDTILREVAEELFGIEEAKRPTANRDLMERIKKQNGTIGTSEGSGDGQKAREKAFCEFLEMQCPILLHGIAIDLLRARPELLAVIPVEDERYFDDNYCKFYLNHETEGNLRVNFYPGVSLEDSLRDAGVIEESLSELLFNLVGTGIVNLDLTYEYAQSLLEREKSGIR